MQPRIVKFFFLVSLLLGITSQHLMAQDGDPVVVKNVKFSSKVNPYKDYLVEVEIEPMFNPDADNAPNPKYVDDIKVTLLIGYELPNKDREFKFHICEVDIATMEVRQSRKIGFWLPYDIAERDDVSKEPQYWYIDLEVDGNKIPITKRNVGDRACSELRNPTAIQSMQNQASNATEGVLLPGYLSGNGYLERGDKRPAFIREEPQ